MSDIWVTSDTHFGHENIIRFSGRPFACAADMDEALIANWNSVVKPQDKVYHLGDVYFAQGWQAIPRLNGHKRLILGNHDNGKDGRLYPFFDKIMLWRDFHDLGILLTHVPVHPDHIIHANYDDGSARINVHGHIHEKKSPDARYRNVCVEQTNYTPVNIEELRVR